MNIRFNPWWIVNGVAILIVIIAWISNWDPIQGEVVGEWWSGWTKYALILLYGIGYAINLAPIIRSDTKRNVAFPLWIDGH